MGLFLLISFGFGGCFLMMLLFGALKAGRKADEREEEIHGIVSPAFPNDTTA